MKPFDEKEIIRGLKKGDKSCIDILYKTYHQRIYAFALSYLKVSEDALDVAHEVFICLWEKREKLDAEKNIESFVFAVTRNTVLSIFRKRASEQKYLSYLTSLTIEDTVTEKMVNYNLLNEKVETLVAQLPPRRREVYTLSRKRGLSNKEISTRMNITEKTVEDHITKALASLRNGLKGVGVAGMMFYYLFL